MSIDQLIAPLFQPERDVRGSLLARLAIVALFVAGLAGWAYVMGFGRVTLDFHDWTGINLPRLLFLQNALRGGEWPLHMAGTASLHGVTDRFLALPDVITSPQTLLLLTMPVTMFVVVDVLIHYASGFAGLWLLRRHFNWSLVTFTVVFLLFLFNGHILAHYSVGHFSWGSYFLFPVVALLIFRFLDGDDSWRSVACFAAVMFYMVLAGGEHHMTWVLVLLALLVPFCWRRAWWLAAVAIASGLLSAVRLLPPSLEIHSFRSAGLVADVIGFPSLSHLLTAMVSLRREWPAYNEALPGNIWFFDSAFFEFTAYTGVLGLAFIVAGLYQWLKSEPARYRELAVPLLVMTALSIGSTYRLLRATGIPLVEGERYTARLFSLPLLFFIVLAAVSIDQLFKHVIVSVWQRALALVGLIFLAIDIASAARLWRVGISAGLFGPTSFNVADAAVVHRADPAYINVLLLGGAITVVTGVVLTVLAARER